LSLDSLKAFLGLNGEHFWRLARGIDSRLVVPDRDAKSISHESTFHIDIEDEEVLRAWLLELTDQVTRRMRRYHIRGRTVQLKMRYSNFETITRAQTLGEPSNVTQEISEIVLELFDRNKSQISRGIRLLGVGVSHLSGESARQLSLFDETEHRRHQRMDAATDQVRDRFGKDALMRAANLQHQIQYRPDPNKRDSQGNS
jgi:DNA polymerase-4